MIMHFQYWNALYDIANSEILFTNHDELKCPKK